MNIFTAIEQRDYGYILQTPQEYSLINENGYSPLFVAIQLQDMQAFTILCSRSAHIENEYGFTPMMYAASINRYQFIELLLSTCTNKQLKKQYKHYPRRSTALTIACLEGNIESARILYQYEADQGKISIAHILAIEGKISEIRMQQLNEAKQDIIDNTPLHYYVYSLVKQQKQSTNDNTESSNDSMYLSNPNINVEPITLKDIQYNIQHLSMFCGYQNSFGLTVLMIAVVNQHVDLVQVLSTYEQRIQSIKLFKYQNYVFYPGFTALMLSTALKNYRISQLLIQELGFKTIYGHLAIDFLEVDYLAFQNNSQEPGNTNEKSLNPKNHLINGIHKIFIQQYKNPNDGIEQQSDYYHPYPIDINYIGLLRQERIHKFQKETPKLQTLIKNASRLTELQNNKVTERSSSTTATNAAVYVSNFESSSQLSQKLSKSSRLREEINQAINNSIQNLHKSCLLSSRTDIYGYNENKQDTIAQTQQITSKEVQGVNIDINVNLYRLEDAVELEHQNDEFTQKNPQQKTLFIEDWIKSTRDQIFTLYQQLNLDKLQSDKSKRILELLLALSNVEKQEKESENNTADVQSEKQKEEIYNPYKNIEIFNYFQYLNRKNRKDDENQNVNEQKQLFNTKNIVSQVRILNQILNELESENQAQNIKTMQLKQELREVTQEARRNLKKEYEEIIKMLEAEINRIKSRSMVDKQVQADIFDWDKGIMTENLEIDIGIQTDPAQHSQIVQTAITLLQQLDTNMVQLKTSFRELKEISRALQAAVAEYQVKYLSLQKELEKFVELTDEQDILIDFDIQSEMEDLRQIQSQATTMILPSRIMSMNISAMEIEPSLGASPFDSLSGVSVLSTLSRRTSIKAQRKKQQQKVLLPVETIANAMQKASSAKLDFQKAKQLQTSLQTQIDELTLQLQAKHQQMDK